MKRGLAFHLRSFAEIVPVVLKRLKCEKFTGIQMDDRQDVTRKAQLSFQLRWAKNRWLTTLFSRFRILLGSLLLLQPCMFSTCTCQRFNSFNGKEQSDSDVWLWQVDNVRIDQQIRFLLQRILSILETLHNSLPWVCPYKSIFLSWFV